MDVTDKTIFISLQPNIASVESGSNILQAHALGLVDVLAITQNASSYSTIKLQVSDGPRLSLEIIKGVSAIDADGTWKIKRRKKVEFMVYFYPDGSGPASSGLLTSYARLSRSNKNIKIGRYSPRKHTYTIRGRKEGTSELTLRHFSRDGQMLELEQAIEVEPKP